MPVLFDVIHADPPWSFLAKGSRISPDNDACAAGYDVMETEDIVEMDMGRFAKENAALFLWSTSTHLLD